MSEKPEVAEVRRMMADVLDLSGVLLEAAAGYRQQAIGQGFSETVAEQMAADFHRAMITKAFAEAS
jgi:hypothetical protein